jgi:hypothetical protein
MGELAELSRLLYWLPLGETVGRGMRRSELPTGPAFVRSSARCRLQLRPRVK